MRVECGRVVRPARGFGRTRRRGIAAIRPERAPRRVQCGFTYLLVLFLVAALGLFAAQTGVVWHLAAQREREAELLAIGVEFARALARYRDASPDGLLPDRLQSLIEDRRSGALVRHLRRIYRDPFTGETTWGLEMAAGRISGIYSLAAGTPIREHDLPPELGSGSEGAKKYSEWVFRPAASGPGDGGAGDATSVRAAPAAATASRPPQR